MSDPDSTSETFIVRLHRRQVDIRHWHGQVQHVRTGHAIIIHGLVELLSCFEPFFPPEDDPARTPSNNQGLK